MNTRHSGDPAGFSPERNLSNPRISRINIGMNIVAAVGRARTPREREAMFWLCNYARLNDLYADQLSGELDLPKPSIREALTDPEADISVFVRRVGALRAKWEADLPPMVETKVRRTVRDACAFADANPAPVEIVGKTRMGKTACAAREYAARMGYAAWLDCPSDDTERTFIFDFARALGIGVGNGVKASQLRHKIKGCFGASAIRMLFIDEAHNLMPANPKVKPKRLEFVRELYDQCKISVIVVATPQYSDGLAAAMDQNPLWAPGQWEGRVQRWHLADTMGERDLAAVARHFAPEADAATVDQLVLGAKATDGYCGAMVNVIRLAKFRSGNGPVTLDGVIAAQAQQARGTRLEKLARSQSSGGRP